MAVPRTSTILRHSALTEGAVKTMFLSKLKNVVALVTVAVILTAGAGGWRYVAVAGQTEKQPAEKPMPAARHVRPVDVRKEEVLKAPANLPKDRRYQIDLRIEREKDGQRTLVASPRLLTLEGVPASVAKGMKTPPIYIGRGNTEEITLGTIVQLVVRAEGRGKVRLDMTVTRSGPITVGQDVELKTRSVRFLRTRELGEPIVLEVAGDKNSSPLYVTAAVQEVEKETNPNTIAAAEKDLKMAEYWGRSGHLDSARFYYELIRGHYPDTIYAERAAERLAEIKKQEKKQARVGQIFIIGNVKTSDVAILEQVPFIPGQPLNYSDLRIAEQNLSRLKGFKSNPKVTVLDREGDGEFKDIQIAVEER